MIEADKAPDLSEGWGVFTNGDRLEIQRVDDPAKGEPKFESDEAALAFVQKQADEGYFRHLRALAMTGQYSLEGAEEPAHALPTDETTHNGATMNAETHTLLANWANVKDARRSLALSEARLASDLTHVFEPQGCCGPEIQTACHVYQLNPDSKAGGVKVLRAAFGLSLRDAIRLWEVAEFHHKNLA